MKIQEIRIPGIKVIAIDSPIAQDPEDNQKPSSRSAKKSNRSKTDDGGPASNSLQLIATYLIKPSVRGTDDEERVRLNDDSIVEFVFDDETSWFCSNSTIDELFPELVVPNRSGDDVATIPVALDDESERGIGKKIFLKIVRLFTKKGLNKAIGKLAAQLEEKQLDGQLGIFRVGPAFDLQPFSKEITREPYLLLLHGTASSTKGSFGKLQGKKEWNTLQQMYGSRIVGFQHESLTKSALENAIDLIEALPKKCTLHIVSQSHGGLVGEVLSRYFSTGDGPFGFSDTEIQVLSSAGRNNDVANINRLKELFQGRNIKIEKFVRVACPAGGSTLASDRLDHFLNMVFNLIRLAIGGPANPVYTIFTELISTVIGSKNDKDALPGLEALNPSSPFIKVLNAPGSDIVIVEPLVVISGNAKIKINFKALLIIATKLFFRRSNDLIVDTQSMYQGSKRRHPVQYYIDEGPEVDHFHYYGNDATAEALMNALNTKVGDPIPLFQIRKEAFTESQRGIVGLEIGQLVQVPVSGSRPIVVLIPGIMGSNLGENKPLWIDYGRFIVGDLLQLDIKKSPRIKALSLVRTSYAKLAKFLSEFYDVFVFPFDWRKQLASQTDALDKEIKKLMELGQPIKIIGHSMGGVLVRDFMVYKRITWNNLNARNGFKLVFLGAPLGGSYRIPAVLFGKDGLIEKLSKIDLFHDKKDLLQVFTAFPGILSLLPLSDEHDFSDPAFWQTMRKASGDPTWPIPSASDLKEFGDYKREIRKGLLETDFSNASYIAGQDKATVCSLAIDGKELEFFSTKEGDASVTWDSGIPAKLIASNSVYYSNITHGSLANEPKIFVAISELLNFGTTNQLSKTRPTFRGGEKLFRHVVEIDYDLSDTGVAKTILGLADETSTQESRLPINVDVTHGDLKFSNYPLLSGHFEKDGILYAEKAIDAYLGKALSQRHMLGLYPGRIGTNEIVISTDGQFTGAIIVGLGPPGELTAYQLTQTVEQGVLKYLLQLNTGTVGKDVIATDTAGVKYGISSLIVASGYGGLTIESSIRAILQGVVSANVKIGLLFNINPKLIQEIEFVEQYSDRALGCFRSLVKIEKERNDNVQIALKSRRIVQKPGYHDRLPFEETEGWWTRISVQHLGAVESNIEYKDEDTKAEFKEKIIDRLRFTISTGAAREEVRLLNTSVAIIDQLIEDISTNHKWTPQLAKTIFELLIPNDFKERLKKQSNISWIVDERTARYPWEMLQDGANAKPLSVNGGMIRQLAINEYRTNVNIINNNKALIIADPDIQGFLGQLPGAFKEGQEVDTILKANRFDTTCLLNESSSKIVQTLFSEDYKIIHLAGHGDFNAKAAEEGGMVIGKKARLSSREIAQLNSVPELVFVNCCFLGKVDGIAEEFYSNRFKLAANLGVQLIRNGVKVVIAAGWEVNDSDALTFTKVFYTAMFEGDTVGDAVRKARISIFSRNGSNNTWGAYQVYGDPFYRLIIRNKHRKHNYEFIIPQEAIFELENLRSDIETNNASTDEYFERYLAIRQAVERSAIQDAAIVEREALICIELCQYDLALEQFEILRKMESARFTIFSMEEYCQVRSKKIIRHVIETRKDKLSGKSRAAGKALKDPVKEMDKVIADAELLLTISRTAERLLLMGHLHREKALIVDDDKKKIALYVQAADYYHEAAMIKNYAFGAYPYSYWLEVETILCEIETHDWGKKLPKSLASAIHELTKMLSDSRKDFSQKLDYWSILAPASLTLTRYFIEPGSSDVDVNKIVSGFAESWKKAGTKGKRFCEIDHCNSLEDLLSLSNKRRLKLKRDVISKIRVELEKLA